MQDVVLDPTRESVSKHFSMEQGLHLHYIVLLGLGEVILMVLSLSMVSMLVGEYSVSVPNHVPTTIWHRMLHSYIATN